MSSGDPVLASDQIERYLDRIGAPRERPAPGADSLASLQRAHLHAVPFENLDISLGRPIRLDAPSLFAKVIDRRRGGYCYELNGLFAALLRGLGYGVTLASARVATPAGLTDEFDHLALLVSVEPGGERWLVDVGFGDAFIDPIPLVDGFARPEMVKSVGLARSDAAWHYREQPAAGAWRDQYVFTETPRALADFGPRNEWQQTSPDSNFTRKRVTSLLTDDGRVTLSGHRLIVTSGGRRTEHDLGEDAATAVLAERFGIVLEAQTAG
jgi:N-hydroxyarylamine O-acetyltransferase